MSHDGREGVITGFLVEEFIGDDGAWSNGWEGGVKATDKLLAALAGAGFKVLARNPTAAMAETWGDEDGPDSDAQSVWRTYWDAAPTDGRQTP